MKSRSANTVSILIVTAVLLTACSGGTASPKTAATNTNSANVVPGEVIVQFHPGTSTRRIEEVVEATGTRVAKHLGMPLVYLLRFSGGIPVEEMVQRLKSYPEVQHVEPNRVIRLEPPRMPPVKPDSKRN